MTSSEKKIRFHRKYVDRRKKRRRYFSKEYTDRYTYITQVMILVSTKLDIVKIYYERNIRINNLNRRQSQFLSELLIMMRTKRLLTNDDAEKLSTLIRRVRDEYLLKSIIVSIKLKKKKRFFVSYFERMR